MNKFIMLAGDSTSPMLTTQEGSTTSDGWNLDRLEIVSLTKLILETLELEDLYEDCVPDYSKRIPVELALTEEG